MEFLRDRVTYFSPGDADGLAAAISAMLGAPKTPGAFVAGTTPFPELTIEACARRLFPRLSNEAAAR